MRKLELLSIGAWAPIDHLFCMHHYPEEGETITVQAERENGYFGDCSFNLAVIAGTLGIVAGAASVVGEDFGAIGYEAYLQAKGIDTQRIVKVPGRLCGHNYLYFDGDGKGFCFSQLGAAEEQDHYSLSRQELEGIGHVVINEKFGKYTLEALRLAKELGAITYINGMVDTAEPEFREEFLRLTDVIFMNNSEYQRLLKKTEPKCLFRDYQVEKLFVTEGKRGCRILTRDGVRREDAVLTSDVKDTTGAGDSFAAGVITGLIKGLDDITSVHIGAVVSSLVVRAWGCQTNAPTWQEMRQEYIKYYSEEEII